MQHFLSLVLYKCGQALVLCAIRPLKPGLALLLYTECLEGLVYGRPKDFGLPDCLQQLEPSGRHAMLPRQASARSANSLTDTVLFITPMG